MTTDAITACRQEAECVILLAVTSNTAKGSYPSVKPQTERRQEAHCQLGSTLAASCRQEAHWQLSPRERVIRWRRTCTLTLVEHSLPEYSGSLLWSDGGASASPLTLVEHSPCPRDPRRFVLSCT